MADLGTPGAREDQPVADPQLAGRRHPKFDPRTGKIWEAPVDEEAAGPPAEMPESTRVTARRLLGDK